MGTAISFSLTFPLASLPNPTSLAADLSVGNP